MRPRHHVPSFGPPVAPPPSLFSTSRSGLPGIVGRTLVSLAVTGALAAGAAPMVGCGTAPASSPHAGVATRSVFDAVVPSVVAVLNDDAALREEEAQLAMEEMGVEARAPKEIIDVSLRKEPTPNGTGFLVFASTGAGGADELVVLTAAHVILTPNALKLTTKGGQTAEAELVHIDEVRDVAILRPKAALAGVPPLRLAGDAPEPGKRVWAMGHTGAGLWTLSWGVSEGITAGVVDMLGASLLLFDAPVYPGFSGGPVITLDDAGKPVVVGVNHAILFAGGTPGVASISSAASVKEIRATMAKTRPAIEARLADFAKTRLAETHAEMFVTKNLSLHRDPQMVTTAAIVGHERTIEPGPDDVARVPVVAMVFGLKEGKHEVAFELRDPDGAIVGTSAKRVEVARERVSFASADFRFVPRLAGRYDLVGKVAGKEIGRTDVWIEDPDDDDQPLEHDDAIDGELPRVDVVVASFGNDDPLALGGIRASWSEYRYPRRVGFTWFARGTRGFKGTNVAISAFVLDDEHKIVGRGVGCFKPELRPEQAWTCGGQGGTPLLRGEGRYDVVFTLNDRPVAVWPMEAMVRTTKRGSVLDRWIEDLKRSRTLKKHPTPKPAR